ncbi:hypothetical protein MHD_07510 [Mannheimia granulomatis]|uniref:Uncharacterized protein n=1 Tax=Mannheimia granulomatis TaxID=85402 RepID=A0A011MJI6_9PAST|nr:hypothetical protein AK33_04870 [Mannheimia granulomatis]RGE47982.1 hypothetical protein MHD_07510 [Mannheimia granulomatis]
MKKVLDDEVFLGGQRGLDTLNLVRFALFSIPFHIGKIILVDMGFVSVFCTKCAIV